MTCPKIECACVVRCTNLISINDVTQCTVHIYFQFVTRSLGLAIQRKLPMLSSQRLLEKEGLFQRKMEDCHDGELDTV